MKKIIDILKFSLNREEYQYFINLSDFLSDLIMFLILIKYNENTIFQGLLLFLFLRKFLTV